MSLLAHDARQPWPPAAVCEQIMGPAWNELPASIRATHLAGESRGFIQVSWGRGLLARCLARVLGFPPPCARRELILEVQPVDGGDRWVRRMGTVTLTSTQSASNGLLLESFGRFVFAFRLLPHQLGLRYLQEHAALRLGAWQLRLPRWASPRIVAAVAQTPAGPRTEVEVAAPLIGRVLRYEGIVQPAPSERQP